MRASFWKGIGGLAACGLCALLLTAGAARAGDPALDELRARLEKVEQENRALKQRLEAVEQTPVGASQKAPAEVDGGVNKADVQKLIDDAIKDRSAKDKKAAENKKAEEAEKKSPAHWYEVGTDLSMSASWKNGLFFTTPHGDFTMHVGGWVHYDNVFWTQGPLVAPPGSRAGTAQGVASGPATGGIGDLEDGTYFRRIRLMTDGTFWEQGEFTLILALENDQFSTVGLDEFWVGAKDIPLINTVRIGHVKTPMGLEGDMTASSRTMTFMERSSYSEAIEENENFVTGLWASNNYFDQRATWSAAVFRQDQGASSGAYFGDGQWGAQGRVTALPLWSCDGRHYLHLGWSGGWRNGTSNFTSSPYRTFQLRARPELRDDDPAASPSGTQTVPNSNSNRLVDTGVIVAEQQWITGLELLYVLGPFSVQAEYGLDWIEDATGFNPSGSALKPAVTGAQNQNYHFHGGYIQLAYTLTGESRSYDRRLGRLDTYYFGRQGPFTKAFFVRDEHGNWDWGWGAWEIAARYSYINLNSGTGLDRVAGGEMDGWTVGLNWHLNDNFKFMFDYVYDHRFGLPAGVIPGFTQGFGMRMQFMY